MADDPTEGGQEPQAEGQEPISGAEPAGQTPETFDADYVRKLRAEAAANRKKAQEANDRLKAIEDAQKSALELATEKLAELERANAELQERQQQIRNQTAITTAAQKAGVVDLDAAYRLLDPAEFDYDDNERLKNADALVARLIEAKPWLKPAASAGSPANPVRGGGQPPGETDAERRRRLGFA